MSTALSRVRVEARACAFLLQVAAASCTAKSEPIAESTLPVELVGCALEGEDGLCGLPEDGALTAFVPAPHGDLRVQADGEPLAASEVKLAEGTRLRFVVPQSGSELSVQAGGASFVRGLRPALVSAPLRAATELRNAGDLEGAVQALGAALPNLSGLEKARALGQLARVELGRGHNDAAVAAFEQALALDRTLGARSLEMADATALSFLLGSRLMRFREAQTVLDSARSAAESTADGRARFPYFEGLLAFELGDLRRALASFRVSQQRAERLGLTLHAFTARDRVASVLDALGRSDEAILELAAWRENPDLRGCERADLQINLAWFRIERPAATDQDLRAAEADLQDALGLFPSACGDTHRQAIAFTNLSYARAGRSKFGEARAALEQARALPFVATESLSSWWLELEGLIALGEDEPGKARKAFERAVALARTQLSPEAEWRAQVGLAQAHERLGALDAALLAFEAAEHLLDAQALAAPLGEGRAAFLARHAESARGAVAVALRLEEPARALLLARRARARLQTALGHAARMTALSGARRAAFTQLVEDYRRGREALLGRAEAERDLPSDAFDAARARQRADQAALTAKLEAGLAALSLTESNSLPELTDGALTLLFHRGRSGWLGFASEAGKVRVRTLGELPDARTPDLEAALLLAPFADELGRARSLCVLAEDTLLAVDFHALPFGDGPLLATLPVSYPLDVADGASAADGRRALVVADPARNLPRARSEAANVARTLSADGFLVASLTGDAATSNALTRALSQSDHIHFAGHALSAGQDGWNSTLGLARGETMSVGDLLALGTSARTVVLASCEAGQGRRQNLRGLSMADAFVLAGAERVIAPARAVNDADTAALMDLLYAHAARHEDLAEALQGAELALRMRGNADWSAFRIITR